MPCFTVPPGIRFNDCLFSDPVPVGTWHPPSCAGIVVVLARNPQWGPKPLQPLYFGEVGSLPTSVRREDLLVGTLLMPYSTPAQRRVICSELVATYRPACQADGRMVSTVELARKVDELEVRQQEQNQQILSLLSNLAKVFEPQTVGPRKPIGFLPAPATESGS